MRKVSKVFHGSFMGDSRDFQGYLKEVQRIFLGSFQYISRKFRRCKEIVKCVNCKGCFKTVAMKFCFAILLFHGSLRSYLSRRNACFVWSTFSIRTVDYGGKLGKSVSIKQQSFTELKLRR